MKIKSDVKKWIIAISLVFIFSFFAGFYLNYRLTKQEKSKVDIIQDIMENEWYYGIDEENIEEEMQTRMILGMLDEEKDPHTKYLTSLGPLADNFKGIGVSVSVYGKYFIIEEVNSNYAIADGLKVGDIITKLDDLSVENFTTQKLNELVENDSDGLIKLTIIRNGVELEIYTGIEEYNQLTVFTKTYSNSAYVKITQFNMDTAQHVENYLSQNSQKNLIIDLRGNPGGYISSVRDVLDLFVESNKVVMSTVDKHGNIQEIRTTNDHLYVFDKIIVLIDDMSASGAEALSAALNYHLDSIVTLYGEKTYGKGSAQKTYMFDDGSCFHYTYALWNTPEGKTINHKGVLPEVESVNKGISSYTIEGREMKLYDYGNDAGIVQIILQKEGLYSGEVHSFMDEETVEALMKFQENHGLTVNGKIDMETLRYVVKLMYDDKVVFLDNQLNEVLWSM